MAIRKRRGGNLSLSLFSLSLSHSIFFSLFFSLSLSFTNTKHFSNLNAAGSFKITNFWLFVFGHQEGKLHICWKQKNPPKKIQYFRLKRNLIILLNWKLDIANCSSGCLLSKSYFVDNKQKHKSVCCELEFF